MQTHPRYKIIYFGVFYTTISTGKLVKSFLPLLGIIYVAWAFARWVDVDQGGGRALLLCFRGLPLEWSSISRPKLEKMFAEPGNKVHGLGVRCTGIDQKQKSGLERYCVVSSVEVSATQTLFILHMIPLPSRAFMSRPRERQEG